MAFDYSIWVKKHNACVQSVLRLCELDRSKEAVKKSVKCNSTLCVMGNAMQDIQGYFERNVRSTAELCFLIRNVDVIISGILDINRMLFGIGGRQDKAIERCFTKKDIVCQFRTLRSLILAHPVDTNYVNDKGESEIVYKNTNIDNDNHFKLNMCYSGTDITNGMGIIKITSVGNNTELGIIGASLNQVEQEKTPLEKQINKLVFVCTIISGVIFLLTMLITFINYSELEFFERIVESILAGITIAMATIPEEIPVVLTVFLAMGAWELTKVKTLTR